MHQSQTLLVTTAVILSLATMAVMSIASAMPYTQPDSTTAQTFTILATPPSSR